MPTKEELITTLLEDMTEEELTKFLDSQSTPAKEVISESVFVDNSSLFKHAQGVYAYQTIPDSNIACSQCGRTLVNDEQHAKDILADLGGENN